MTVTVSGREVCFSLTARPAIGIALIVQLLACEAGVLRRSNSDARPPRSDGINDSRPADLNLAADQNRDQGLIDQLLADRSRADGSFHDLFTRDLPAADLLSPDLIHSLDLSPLDSEAPDRQVPDQQVPDQQAPDASTPIPTLPASVLIVYNADDAESLAVADHYATQRGIPAQNKCAISPGHTVYIPWDDFDDKIKTPIKDCLNAVGPDKILYIVFSYRTPYKFYPKPPHRRAPAG